MDKSLVYLILGSPRSGRRSVVADLIEFGLNDPEKPAVFASPTESSEKIGSKCDISVAHYDWDGETLSVPLSNGANDPIFIVADGRSNPADFVEAFHSWLGGTQLELARVITVVDCSLAEKVGKMRDWLDCCIHFSDVAILAQRIGVSNKWVTAFQERYEKELCYPCLFEMDRKGRVRNPAMVLDPLARRITRIFDAADEYVFEEDDEEDEEEIPDEELTPGDLSSDPYLKRLLSGRREIEIPDISDLIPDTE